MLFFCVCSSRFYEKELNEKCTRPLHGRGAQRGDDARDALTARWQTLSGRRRRRRVRWHTHARTDGRARNDWVNGEGKKQAQLAFIVIEVIFLHTPHQAPPLLTSTHTPTFLHARTHGGAKRMCYTYGVASGVAKRPPGGGKRRQQHPTIIRYRLVRGHKHARTHTLSECEKGIYYGFVRI